MGQPDLASAALVAVSVPLGWVDAPGVVSGFVVSAVLAWALTRRVVAGLRAAGVAW